MLIFNQYYRINRSNSNLGLKTQTLSQNLQIESIKLR